MDYTPSPGGRPSPLIANLFSDPKNIDIHRLLSERKHARVLQELNPEQQKAVADALVSDYLLIQGPPGTGKTTVITKILDLLVEMMGKWTLMIAPSTFLLRQLSTYFC